MFASEMETAINKVALALILFTVDRFAFDLLCLFIYCPVLSWSVSSFQLYFVHDPIAGTMCWL